MVVVVVVVLLLLLLGVVLLLLLLVVVVQARERRGWDKSERWAVRRKCVNTHCVTQVPGSGRKVLGS